MNDETWHLTDPGPSPARFEPPEPVYPVSLCRYTWTRARLRHLRDLAPARDLGSVSVQISEEWEQIERQWLEQSELCHQRRVAALHLVVRRSACWRESRRYVRGAHRPSFGWDDGLVFI